MIISKLFFSLLGLFIFFLIFRLKYSFQIRVIEKIILFILFILGFTIIFNPIILDKAAKVLNIERGRDLLFYLYMMITSWGLIRSHIRINYQSSRIKKIISEIALNNLKDNKKRRKKIK